MKKLRKERMKNSIRKTRKKAREKTKNPVKKTDIRTIKFIKKLDRHKDR